MLKKILKLDVNNCLNLTVRCNIIAVAIACRQLSFLKIIYSYALKIK